jgi:hypothetical protein
MLQADGTTRGSEKASSGETREDRSRASDRWAGRLAWLQGAFYFVTGIWPLLHMRSFLWVTGPKTDLWLVRTVAGLLTVIGACLWLAGRRNAVTREMGFVGAASSAVLIAIDVIYVAKHVISPIYLLDAVVEAVIVAGWIACAVHGRRITTETSAGS